MSDRFSVELKAMAVLFDGSHETILNMNDTFGIACADSGTFDLSDFALMAPVLAEHGHDALTAYVAVGRGCHPIPHFDRPAYRQARAAIESIRAIHTNFCPPQDDPE
jgi:uncharacterized protein with PIN domain